MLEESGSISSFHNFFSIVGTKEMQEVFRTVSRMIRFHSAAILNKNSY